MPQEPALYYQIARYPKKTAAGKAYDPIQAIIFEEDCDLSAYRFFERNERKCMWLLSEKTLHHNFTSALKQYYSL